MIYDPYSRQMQEDPYPTYRYFRDEEPCTPNPKLDFYALFRFEDVWGATLDWKTYSSSLGPILENKGEIPGEVMSIIGMDPPRHVRIRNLVSTGFTPRRSLDAVAGERAFDFQAALSNLLPMDVISLLVGIPEADRATYRGWVDKGLERDPETGKAPPGAAEGMWSASAYGPRLLGEG